MSERIRFRFALDPRCFVCWVGLADSFIKARYRTRANNTKRVDELIVSTCCFCKAKSDDSNRFLETMGLFVLTNNRNSHITAREADTASTLSGIAFCCCRFSRVKRRTIERSPVASTTRPITNDRCSNETTSNFFLRKMPTR